MITLSQHKLTELLLKCKAEKKDRICPYCMETYEFDRSCDCDMNG